MSFGDAPVQLTVETIVTAHDDDDADTVEPAFKQQTMKSILTGQHTVSISSSTSTATAAAAPVAATAAARRDESLKRRSDTSQADAPE